MAKLKIKYHNLFFYLTVLLLALLIFNLYTVWQLNRQIDAIEAGDFGVGVSIALVSAPDCEECTDVSAIATALKQNPEITVIKETKIAFEDAGELIEKYSIKRLPAAIITGNIAELNIESIGINKFDDALVFDKTPPPYYDTAEKRKAGLVSVTIINDRACKKCHNLANIIPQFTQVGIKITEQKILDISEAEEIIDKYGITKIPTMILNREAQEYEILSPLWKDVGTVEDDGNLVLREVIPPYKELGTGKIRGVADLTYLDDKSCDACYEPNLHKKVLQQNFALETGNETTIDISSAEGKKLIRKYNITIAPTVIVSPEASVYKAFAQSWPELGTKQEDGSYVFREVEKLGVAYKNLETGKVTGTGTP